MRVALIKQVTDVFGPWGSVRWVETNPQKLFDIWPGKAALWEMTCLLQADWYVIPKITETDYQLDLLAKHPKLLEIVTKHAKNVIDPNKIPFDDYDIVISFDPILNRISSSRILLCYYVNEHWDRLYKESLKQPIGGYDLFLAHMMDTGKNVTWIPQALSFPYLRGPNIVRSVFKKEKEDMVWVDQRTLITLGMEESWTNEAKKAAIRIEELLRKPVCYSDQFDVSAYGVSDPPLWGNAADYLGKMNRCKYFLSVGRIQGPGQELSEAASLGCICIGEQNKIYHRIICHPECLCEDMVEMPSRFRHVASSPALQDDVLAWQDQKLRKYFADEPISELGKGMCMKREGGSYKGKIKDKKKEKYFDFLGSDRP